MSGFLQEMKHIVDLQVDNDTDSREINALTKVKSCDHPFMFGYAVITLGLKSLLLLLCVHAFVQCVIHFVYIILYVKSLGKFLDEVNPCAIDNTSIVRIENG